MDENRYKSAFDKIKCCREFYMQMTEQLSESGDGYPEYTETVSHVDVAKPVKYRYAAVGTAACIAVCAAGFGFWKISAGDKPENRTIETDGTERVENPIIMPATTEPVITHPAVTEPDNLVKDGETPAMSADVMVRIESGEIKPVYDQSPKDNDNCYEVNYDPAELKGWLERLQQIYWTKKTITAEEFNEYCKHIMIMGDLYFTPDGIIHQCNGQYELHIPEKMGSRKVYDSIYEQITVRRYQNLEEFLTNYKELSPVMTADMEYILSPEDIVEKSVDELNEILAQQFSFDNFRWQQENRVSIPNDDRAEDLNRVLYKCPHCLTEGKMVGKGIHVTCGNCGKAYELTEFGALCAVEGEGKFTHVPDWYRWERECVRQELLDGSYKLDVPVDICMMVDTKCVYQVGEGRLVHDTSGFHLTGCDGKLDYYQKPQASYSLYSDYYWYELGDMVCIGNMEVLYYCFPKECGDVVAKTRLAAEELYKLVKNGEIKA